MRETKFAQEQRRHDRFQRILVMLEASNLNNDGESRILSVNQPNMELKMSQDRSLKNGNGKDRPDPPTMTGKKKKKAKKNKR